MSCQKGIDYTGITIVFFCHDGNGNYVFQKRSKNCRDEQGNWDSGGGGLDFGDTIEDTLKKEILEEYNSPVLEFEFLGNREVFRELNGKKTHWISFDYKVLVDREKVKMNEPHKFDDLKWFKLSELPDNLHSQIPYTIEKYKDKL